MKGHIKLFTLQLDLELAAKRSCTARAYVDKTSKLSAKGILPLMD
jgi:hypothetical protein